MSYIDNLGRAVGGGVGKHLFFIFASNSQVKAKEIWRRKNKIGSF